METVDKGALPILGGTEQKDTRLITLLRRTHNLKRMNWLFLDFWLLFSDYRWLQVTETMGSETMDKGGLSSWSLLQSEDSLELPGAQLVLCPSICYHKGAEYPEQPGRGYQWPADKSPLELGKVQSTQGGERFTYISFQQVLRASELNVSHSSK